MFAGGSSSINNKAKVGRAFIVVRWANNWHGQTVVVGRVFKPCSTCFDYVELLPALITDCHIASRQEMQGLVIILDLVQMNCVDDISQETLVWRCFVFENSEPCLNNLHVQSNLTCPVLDNVFECWVFFHAVDLHWKIVIAYKVIDSSNGLITWNN